MNPTAPAAPVVPAPSDATDRLARRTFHGQATWSAVFTALVGPLVLTALAITLGVPDVLMGFLGVLPSLAGALTLLTAALVAGWLSPRTATHTFVAGSRLLAAGLVVLPMLARTTSAVVLFFVLAPASLTLHAQATSTLSAWMLDFVPDSIRGPTPLGGWPSRWW